MVTTTKSIKFAEPSDNYHEIFVDVSENDRQFMSVIPNNIADPSKKPVSLLRTMFNAMDYINIRSNLIVKHKKMQQLLNSGSHFDLYMLGWFMNEQHLGES